MNGVLVSPPFRNSPLIYTASSSCALMPCGSMRNPTSTEGIGNALLFFVEQAIWSMSLLNRYRPTGYSQVNQYMSGRISVLSQHSECSPWYILQGKVERLMSAFRFFQARIILLYKFNGRLWQSADLLTGRLIIFLLIHHLVTIIFYAELNFLVEAWHRVFTDTER